MELYWKAVGGLLIALVLGLSLGKDISLLLSMAVCVMGAAIAMHYLQPVLTLLEQMAQNANLQKGTLGILLKITGIVWLTEIAAMTCADAGSSAVQKILKMLSCCGILWVSIPIFQEVISLLQQIVGDI